MMTQRDPLVENPLEHRLCRRPTTKLLINHFETLGHTLAADQVADDAHCARAKIRNNCRRKEINPVRQSLKNLVSVIVRGNGFFGLSRPKLVGRQSTVGHITTAPYEVEHLSPPPETTVLPPIGLSDGPSECPQLSSLYHRRNAYEGDNLTTSWIPCGVVVEDGLQLVISYENTWATTGPPQETISLACFTDVRSVSPKNVTPGEYDALPNNVLVDIKVFEILFEGRPRERFATPSSIERAEWLSKIRDAASGIELSLRTHEMSHRSRPVPKSDRPLPQIPVTTPPAPSPDQAPQSTSTIWTATSSQGRFNSTASFRSVSTTNSLLGYYASDEDLQDETNEEDIRTSKVDVAVPTQANVVDRVPTVGLPDNPIQRDVKLQERGCCIDPDGQDGVIGRDLLWVLHNNIEDIGKLVRTISEGLAVNGKREETALGKYATTESQLTTIASQIAVVASKLEEIPKSHMTSQSERAKHQESPSTQATTVVDERLHAKLTTISQLLDALCTRVQGLVPQDEYIIGLLVRSDERQSVQAQQQADATRYLHELDTWLETFVSNGTSQINSLVGNLDRVCKHLGVQTLQDGAPSPPAQGTEGHKAYEQLVLGLETRLDHFATVIQRISDNRSEVASLAELIEAQRREQEAILRGLTAGLSEEVKGERLRFVEAMKEATAINVQLHVNQFKKELSREVMAMTAEVGRLHQEKRVVETQIADLFAFYSKQTSTETRPAPAASRADSATKGGRRPLPEPGRKAGPPFP